MLRASPMVNRFSYTLPWLASILLLCSPVTHAEEDRGDSPPLRVLTYNLLHDGAWSGFFESGTHLEERLDITIQELKRLQPDIIALQEASDSRKHGNVPQRIAEALGYQMVFAPATEHIFGIGSLRKQGVDARRSSRSPSAPASRVRRLRDPAQTLFPGSEVHILHTRPRRRFRAPL